MTDILGGSHDGESGLNLFVNDVKRVRVESSQPAEPAFADSAISIQAAVAELEKLKRLRDQELLTSDQFEALKAVLLNRVV